MGASAAVSSQPQASRQFCGYNVPTDATHHLKQSVELVGGEDAEAPGRGGRAVFLQLLRVVRLLPRQRLLPALVRHLHPANIA